MKLKVYEKAAGVVPALRRAGLAQLPHEVVFNDESGSKGWTALVTVESSEDAAEVRARGFKARVKAVQ